MTDKSLESLAGLEYINDLCLGMEKFSDQGIKQLAELPSLENVRLDGNKGPEIEIAQESWDSLVELPLKSIKLSPCKIDTVQLTNFRIVNPTCKISN